MSAKKSKARKKFEKYVDEQELGLSSEEISEATDGMARFVEVIRRIQTEPQARIEYVVEGKGKKAKKHREYHVELEEVQKIVEPDMDLIDIMRKTHRLVEKRSHVK